MRHRRALLESYRPLNSQTTSDTPATGLRQLGKVARALVLTGGIAMLSQGCSVSNSSLTNAPPTTASTTKIPAPRPVADPDSASMALNTPNKPLTEPGAPPRAPVKVGLILPLTGAGQAALVAESMKKAAELALRDVQASHVQLIVRDDKGTPEGAATAATEVLADGAEIILGPLYARSVAMVSNAARSKNVAVIAFSNDRQVAGSATHLLSFLAGPEVTRVVSYASQKGKRRYVALIPDDAYGKLVEPSFKEAVARHGGSVVATQTYPTDTGGRVASVLTVVKALKDEIRGLEEHGEPIDAIFIPGGEDTVQMIGPLLRQAEIDTKRIKIIGTGALDTPNAGRDDAFVGAWFAAPDPRGFKDFSDKYAKAYGLAPPRISTLAYDAASLAAALATGTDGARFIPSALTRPSGFNGVDGLFRLMSDGVTDRALAVLEVQKFGAAVIDLPPTSLQTAGGPQPPAAIPSAFSSPAPGPSSQLEPYPPRNGVSRVN